MHLPRFLLPPEVIRLSEFKSMSGSSQYEAEIKPHEQEAMMTDNFQILGAQRIEETAEVVRDLNRLIIPAKEEANVEFQWKSATTWTIIRLWKHGPLFRSVHSLAMTLLVCFHILMLWHYLKPTTGFAGLHRQFDDNNAAQVTDQWTQIDGS